MTFQLLREETGMLLWNEMRWAAGPFAMAVVHSPTQYSSLRFIPILIRR